VRWSPGLWAAPLTVIFTEFLTVEWSHPYCSAVQTEGPAYAAFGFPLPWQQFGGVSSLEYAVMPHVYVVDVLVTGLALFALLRPGLRALTRFRWAARTVAVAGVVAALVAIGAQAFVSWATWVPVATIADGYPSRFRDYRPVGVSSPHYDCSPSEFWFGPVARRSVDE
jgi:hypothetical protein